MGWTSDELVAAIRLEAFLPDASDITAANILALADAEVLTLIETMLRSSREEYWVKTADVVLTSARRYRLPRRAALRGLRSISIVDADGIESPLTGLDVGGVPYGSMSTGSYALGAGCYLEDDFVVFPYDPPSGSIRFRYMRQPSKLVPTASCSAISSAVSTTDLATSTQGVAIVAIEDEIIPQYVDVVRGDAPFDLSYTDLLIVDYSADGYELDASTPVDVADFVDLDAISNDRQDYLCLRDQTCYAPLPLELQPVLVAATARRIMELTRDVQGMQMSEATFQARLKSATSAVQPRTQTQAKLLVNRSSSLRGGFRGGGRR